MAADVIDVGDDAVRREGREPVGGILREGAGCGKKSEEKQKQEEFWFRHGRRIAKDRG